MPGAEGKTGMIRQKLDELGAARFMSRTLRLAMKLVLRGLNPRTYYRRARQVFFVARYDGSAVAEGERERFAVAGFDHTAARASLDEVLLHMSGRPFDDMGGTDSVHWLLFSALGLTAWGHKVRRILEIGTFSGESTLVLHELFPEAQIVTCDLPESDPIMNATYGRADPQVRADHLAKRMENIDRPRIRYLEVNSFFLPALAPGPYDLIWVDGGHLYPDVAWDICNAWHAVADDGVILCDDVFLEPGGGDGVYTSPDVRQVLSYIESRTSIELSFFLKRQGPKWSADPRKRKYVGLLRKTTSL